HYSQYFKGIANFKEYRMKLVMAPTQQDVHEALDEVLEVFGENAIAGAVLQTALCPWLVSPHYP
ncbi:MAG: hypothetical protein WCK82_08130, partial [Bacteroidota bacterium]